MNFFRPHVKMQQQTVSEEDVQTPTPQERVKTRRFLRTVCDDMYMICLALERPKRLQVTLESCVL